MRDSRPRRFPTPASWIVLALALVGGNAPAGAQQATPGSLMAPGLAPQSPLTSSTEVTLDEPSPAPRDGATPGNFSPPKLLRHPIPAYPELAHLNRVEGVVSVHFAIDETGHVTAVTIPKSSGSVMLDALSRDYTLREWTFQPATFNGQPVPSGVSKEFEFKLDPAEEKALAEKRLALQVGTPEPPYPPEALALRPPPGGKCTVGVRWTKAGLVDLIYMPQSTGSGALDKAALRFAYANWRTDPATAAKDEPFTKVVTFTPPSP